MTRGCCCRRARERRGPGAEVRSAWLLVGSSYSRRRGYSVETEHTTSELLAGLRPVVDCCCCRRRLRGCACCCRLGSFFALHNNRAPKRLASAPQRQHPTCLRDDVHAYNCFEAPWDPRARPGGPQQERRAPNLAPASPQLSSPAVLSRDPEISHVGPSRDEGRSACVPAAHAELPPLLDVARVACCFDEDR